MSSHGGGGSCVRGQCLRSIWRICDSAPAAALCGAVGTAGALAPTGASRSCRADALMMVTLQASQRDGRLFAPSILAVHRCASEFRRSPPSITCACGGSAGLGEHPSISSAAQSLSESATLRDPHPHHSGWPATPDVGHLAPLSPLRRAHQYAPVANASAVKNLNGPAS